MKQTISDALAWIAFNALILWLMSLVVGISGYWEIYEQLAAFIDTIRGCNSGHCSVQMSLEGTSTDPIWFGIDLSFMSELRFPAFLTWFVIVIFQSFFVGHFRLKPWKILVAIDDAGQS